jgi:hypothetical protein
MAWIVLRGAVAYNVFLLFVILSYVFPKDTFHDFKLVKISFCYARKKDISQDIAGMRPFLGRWVAKKGEGWLSW